MILFYFRIVEQARPDVDIICPTILPEAWVQRQLHDPAMKRLVREALATTSATSPRQWAEDWPQHVMSLVVEHYAGRRPVYYDRPLDNLGPGYRAIEYQTVYRFTADGPAFLRTDGDSPPQGDFPPADYGGVTLGEQGETADVILAAAQSQPRKVRPGELFRVRLAWRCEREVGTPLEVMAFIGPAEPARGIPSTQLFAGGSVPLVRGLLPIPASPRDTHYEQQVRYVASRDLTPGRYVIRMALRPREAGRFAQPQPAAWLDVVP